MPERSCPVSAILFERSILLWNIHRSPALLPCKGAHLKDRHIHGDDHEADSYAQEYHEHWFKHRRKGRHSRIDLFVVEVRDFIEHIVKGAGCLTNSDHLGHHGRKYL